WSAEDHPRRGHLLPAPCPIIPRPHPLDNDPSHRNRQQKSEHSYLSDLNHSNVLYSPSPCGRTIDSMNRLIRRLPRSSTTPSHLAPASFRASSQTLRSTTSRSSPSTRRNSASHVPGRHAKYNLRKRSTP